MENITGIIHLTNGKTVAAEYIEKNEGHITAFTVADRKVINLKPHQWTHIVYV